MKLKSIAVFCASSFGNKPIYQEAAVYVGRVFAQRQIRLVYGGGKVGLMGAIADAVMADDGLVIGVIPDFLNSKEIGHTGVSQLIVVDTMHERKRIMNELCEGIIALPGGFGTMEELFEMLTWGQLGLHPKPIGLLNTDGFYDQLINFIQHMVDSGLLREENQAMLLIGDTIEELLEKMENYVAPAVPKWLNKQST